MSEKDDRLKAPRSESPLSSLGLPASDQPLERVLGAIAKTIESFTASLGMIHSEIVSQGTVNKQRYESGIELLGKMRLELISLSDQLDTVSRGNEITLGATVEARNALDRTRKKLEVAVDDMTGKHTLLKVEEGEEKAPVTVQKIALAITNFIWPIAMRQGKGAIFWGIKILAGSTVIASLGKIISDLIHG